MSRNIVLVTGASSGIGKACALLLAERGFVVYAGVRRPQDGDALLTEAVGKVKPLIVDITKESTVAAAAAELSADAEQTDTVSLVNNAGITVAGPLELLTTEDLRRQFEVNVFGQLAVTRALLPLLRGHHGRIVLMGSIFGRISLPFVAPYTAAKHALGAIAESLSVELRQWKLPVILVEPGNISTPIWQRTKTDVVGSMGAVPQERYALYRASLESFARLTDSYAATGIPPRRVAKAVASALSARRPRRRYTVGWDSRVYGRLAPLLPARLRQWILWRMTLRR